MTPPETIADDDTEVYVTDRATEDVFACGALLCDPLTRLVAYPSFERRLVERLAAAPSEPLHLAIGDVDDLKAHVARVDAADPTHFGHLAGNACMRTIGELTREWADERRADWPLLLCGTFGGDEVVVAAAGVPFDAFLEAIRGLAERTRDRAPCTMSMVAGTLEVPLPAATPPDASYRSFVSQLDAQLFAFKAAARARDGSPCGETLDGGTIAVRPSA